MDLFPKDVMGGKNKRHMAANTVRVRWGGEVVQTDIVRSRNMFRRRGWVRRFFEESRVAAGDTVLLEQLSGYEYRVSKIER